MTASLRRALPLLAAVLPLGAAAGAIADQKLAYMQALQQAVTTNWLRPESATDLSCLVEIVQRPGGEVVQVSLGQPCNADAQVRASINRAVLGASPLPYAGFEKVFQSRVNLIFQTDGH